MGDFNHTTICSRDSTARHRQYRRFLECIGDKFLLQMLEEPKGRGAMLDLVLTYREGLVRNVKLKSSLGYSVHEMLEFKISRTGKMKHSKFTTLDLGRADFVL